ncbi:MAG: GGDEF domain-containing protein [Candidatus Pacebacteria bacterium]|nr:GGDEF domain-containing protein [Candidatus Paceibacterota bacterium]MCF7856878.1 GGDEF domain-containing protein [Candidatus Paceibacterota bacterium]
MSKHTTFPCKNCAAEYKRRRARGYKKYNQAKKWAFTDELTGLPNARAYKERVHRDIAYSKRHGGSLTLALIDIDHFKEFNDTFGHDAGNRVLQLLGTFLNRMCRETDFVGRWGGEEFVILLKNSTTEGAQLYFERLRNGVTQIDSDIKLTCSFGITELQKDDTAQTFFKRADVSLYSAKQNGRNCIVFHSEKD